MGAELIAFTRAVITPEAQAAAQRSLASGWLTTGPECVAFEQEFAAWVGAREAIAVSSASTRMAAARPLAARRSREVGDRAGWHCPVRRTITSTPRINVRPRVE